VDLVEPVMAGEQKRDLGVRAKVVEALPNDLFRVELADQSRVLAHVAPRRGLDFLRLLPGDEVQIEVSPSDRKRARIVKRCEP
jgi:translation initiation factor IF-1